MCTRELIEFAIAQSGGSGFNAVLTYLQDVTDAERADETATAAEAPDADGAVDAGGGAAGDTVAVADDAGANVGPVDGGYASG